MEAGTFIKCLNISRVGISEASTCITSSTRAQDSEGQQLHSWFGIVKISGCWEVQRQQQSGKACNAFRVKSKNQEVYAQAIKAYGE